MRKQKHKTVELVIESRPRQPNPVLEGSKNIRIAIEESALRGRVKAAGGKWLRQKQVWRLPYRNDMEAKLNELGGMCFLNSQKTVSALVNHLQLEVVNFPVNSAETVATRLNVFVGDFFPAWLS